VGLISNASRLYPDGYVEGSAHALMPGNWTSYRQFQKFIEREEGVLKTAANPTGYYSPRVFRPPITEGDMSMRPQGGGSMAADLYPTRAMSIDLTGSGALSATAGLVVSMLLAMTGSGSLAANIEGRLNMSAALTGSGSLDADLSGIASMAVALLGAGDLEATIAAYGNMEIDIVVTGAGLTTANVGQAVWAAIAASNNAAGTMGEKLNDAGSASNPWTEDLSSPQTPGTAGFLLKIASQILRNKQVTDPATGVMTVYDDDGTTVLFTANLFQDAAGAVPYAGEGAERRERLE
jgi:hypothetical protein